VKKRDLEGRLSKLGWYLQRHGGGHDIWTNGQETEAVPRHNEINEMLAKKILRTAQKFPGAGGKK
jgi:mRNA interferase HicA